MDYIKLFLKGIIVGVANVIPGVSGGTIAVVLHIFDRMIDAINHDTISCVIMVERLKHYDWFMSSIKNIKLHKIEETTDLTRIVIYDK